MEENATNWLENVLRHLLHGNAEQIQLANEELEKFQKNPESFSLAFESLTHPDEVVRIFASQTVSKLCKKGPPMLIGESKIREMMFNFLSNNIKDQSSVFDNIAIGLLAYFRVDDSQPSAFISLIINSVENLEQAFLAIRLFSYIPEVCQRKDIAMRKQRRKDIKQLLLNDAQVVQFCLHVFGESGENIDVLVSILKCLTRWIEFEIVDIQTWYQDPGQNFLKSMLTGIISVNQPLFSACEEFLIALIEYSGKCNPTEEFFSLLGQGCTNLINNIPRKCAHIIIVFSKTFVQIIREQEEGCGIFLNYLLQLPRKMHIDDYFTFWDDFCKNNMTNLLDRILQTLGEFARYPDDFEQIDELARADFRFYRVQIRGTMRSIMHCSVRRVSPQMEQWMLSKLKNTEDWKGVEMIVHFFSVINSMMDEEQIQRFLPLVIEGSKIHRAAKQTGCVALSQVTLTFIETVVGEQNVFKIAEFICECCLEQELHPVYEFRVNEDHCAPVALIKLVRNWEMVSCLQILWKTYQHLCEMQFQNREIMTRKSLLLMMEAISEVLRGHPVNVELTNSLNSLLSPTWQRLSSFLSEGNVQNTEFCLEELKHLISKSPWHQDACVNYYRTFFSNHWVNLEPLLGSGESLVVQSICDIIHQPLKYIEELRIRILQISVELISKHPHPSFIELFGNCVLYGEEAHGNIFEQLIVLQHNGPVFTEEEQLACWYKVLTKILSQTPQLFLNNFHLIMESTLFLCTNKHFYGWTLRNSRLIFKFFKCYEYTLTQNNPALSQLFRDENLVQLIQFCLLGIQTGFDSRCLEDIINLYRELCVNHMDNFSRWVTAAVLQHGVPTEKTKEKTKKDYLTVLLGQKSLKNAKYFKKITKAFCGGKKKKQSDRCIQSN